MTLYNLLQNDAHVAAASNDITVIEKTGRAQLSCAGVYFKNTLQAAAEFGHCTIIKHLLETITDINIQNGNPLNAAVERNHLNAARLLIKRGADVNISITDFGSLLQKAVYHQHTDMVSLLIVNGAAIEGQYSKYGSPLTIAAYRTACNTQMLEILITAGADIYQKNSLRPTAIECAVIANYVENVKILLSRGAQGDQALQRAVKLKLLFIARALLDHKPESLQFLAALASSPLVLAVKNEDVEMILLLLEKVQPCFRVPFIDVFDLEQECTAIDLAIQSGQTQIAKILITLVAYSYDNSLYEEYLFTLRNRGIYRS